MRTKLCISIIILSFTIQSCNMAKHYGNMRISHPNDPTITHTIPSQPKVDFRKLAEEKIELCSINQISTDSLIPLEEEKTNESNSGYTSKTKHQQLVLNNRSNRSEPKIQFAAVSSKRPFHKTIKKQLKNPLKKISAAKWIDVDAYLTVIYVLLGIGLLILILGSIFTFSEVGIVILYILLGAALIFAAAFALGLLLMGFLRMCGLNW